MLQINFVFIEISKLLKSYKKPGHILVSLRFGLWHFCTVSAFPWSFYLPFLLLLTKRNVHFARSLNWTSFLNKQSVSICFLLEKIFPIITWLPLQHVLVLLQLCGRDIFLSSWDCHLFLSWILYPPVCSPCFSASFSKVPPQIIPQMYVSKVNFLEFLS